MWIFGYGSLMWKIDFPYVEKIFGYVKGYERKFYQYSIDHRGTPEKPGRVVTLLPGDKEDRVYGVAYKIEDGDIAAVLSNLDYREKGGYKREIVSFYPKNDETNPFDILIYMAHNNNPQYAGPADLPTIADQIIKSHGLSGPNSEYVLSLARKMREIFPDVQDEHLFNLEKEVLAIDNPTQ